MLDLRIENKDTRSDKNMIKELEYMVKHYPNGNLNDTCEVLQNCNFRKYNIGRMGNHIWIKRKNDDVRIAMIM